MNLIHFIKFYLALNRLKYKTPSILINPKPIIDNLDNYKQEFYKKSVDTALNFYSLFAFFDPEDPVHFYMLVW